MKKSQSSSYILYGKHACLAALQNNRRQILKIFASNEIFNDPLFNKHIAKGNYKILPKPEIDKLFPTHTAHQGIALQVLPITNRDLTSALNQKRVAILDQITDPQNLGALLRSAAAFGVKNIIVPQDNAAKENANLAKIASGALETVSITEVVNLAQTIKKLKDAGFWIIGLDHNAKTLIQDYPAPEKLAIVLGNENSGIRPLVQKQCDLLVKIPMQPTTLLDSLNVSTAAAIAFYEMFK